MQYDSLRSFDRGFPVTLRTSIRLSKSKRRSEWGGDAEGSEIYLPPLELERGMATVTKKELIDRIADQEGCKRALVKRVVQSFLDSIVEELGNGNRLEFRDFGVFESKIRAPRQAQNPKTMDPVQVPSKRTVKFKVGRVMKLRLDEVPTSIDEATGLAVEPGAAMASRRSKRA